MYTYGYGLNEMKRNVTSYTPEPVWWSQFARWHVPATCAWLFHFCPTFWGNRLMPMSGHVFGLYLAFFTGLVQTIAV